MMFDEVPATHEFAAAARMAKATQLLATIKESDVDIGTAPKTSIMRRDKVELFRYLPLAAQKVEVPVLIVYGLIGRYTITDLQPDRSLIRSLLGEGLDLWLMDWGRPGRTERWLSIDDYVDDYIDAGVERIRREVGREKVTLLGICQGGVFATCYAALYPDKVQNLVLTVTPIDFHADREDPAPHHGLMNVWTRSLDPADINKLVEGFGGVLPGEFMGSVFTMVTPRWLTRYNIDLLRVFEGKAKLMNFLRMEKWLADRPHHPGEAAKQWLKDLYKDNRLAKGTFVLSGRTVDLNAIAAPTLNIYALDDHVIPPMCAKALRSLIGTSDYTEMELPGGHIGLFVSSISQGPRSKSIAQWLAARD